MGLPISFSVATPSSSPWQATNTFVDPFNLSIAVVVTGTVNYTIQYTLDRDPTGIASAVTVDSIFDLTALASQSTTLDSSITFPVSAWRATLNSGSGSIVVHGLQAG